MEEDANFTVQRERRGSPESICRWMSLFGRIFGIQAVNPRVREHRRRLSNLGGGGGGRGGGYGRYPPFVPSISTSLSSFFFFPFFHSFLGSLFNYIYCHISKIFIIKIRLGLKVYWSEKKFIAKSIPIKYLKIMGEKIDG